MDLNLKGKNALVCGSSKGIGKAAAIEIAKLGANVTLVSRSPQIMSDLVHELDTSLGQDHDFLAADFTQVGAIEFEIVGKTPRSVDAPRTVGIVDTRTSISSPFVVKAL